MKPFREWLAEVQFFLMSTKGGTEHALFLHRTSTFCVMQPIGGVAPAAVGIRESGEIYMLIYYPSVGKLPIPAAAELLKHEVYHPIFGHCGSRGKEADSKYGRKICGIAVDLVVNQFIDMSILEKAGLPGVTVAKYGLEENLTLEQYCNALQSPDPLKPDQQLADRVAHKVPQSDIDIEALIACGNSQEAAGHDKYDTPPMDASAAGVLANGNIGEVSADEITVRIVEQISDDMAQRQKGHSRGWSSSYCQEYVQQVKRKVSTPWHMFLRQLEMNCMSVERLMSRKRPSRRHPAYFGRVKRLGLSAWFVVDTSGSMCGEQLQLVESEVRSLHQRGCEITFVHCDADVTKMEPYSTGLKAFNFIGRGGTDFSPVFDKLSEIPARRRPAFIVYFTDGFGDCYKHIAMTPPTPRYANLFAAGRRPPISPAGIPTLWLVPENCADINAFKDEVPFGTVCVVRGDAR